MNVFSDNKQFNMLLILVSHCQCDLCHLLAGYSRTVEDHVVLYDMNKNTLNMLLFSATHWPHKRLNPRSMNCNTVHWPVYCECETSGPSIALINRETNFWLHFFQRFWRVICATSSQTATGLDSISIAASAGSSDGLTTREWRTPTGQRIDPPAVLGFVGWVIALIHCLRHATKVGLATTHFSRSP